MTVAGARGEGGSGGGANLKLLGEVKQENLGQSLDKPDYYSTNATITFFSKDKALYKSCGSTLEGGKTCQKKVTEVDGGYQCQKCLTTKTDFAWRMILQINMADSSDNNWATCFQDTAEKILGVSSQELGEALEHDEEKYNSIFSEAVFRSFSFKLRCKTEQYNDESRVKHSVIESSDINWSAHCANLIKEIEAMGGTIPDSINRNQYQ